MRHTACGRMKRQVCGARRHADGALAACMRRSGGMDAARKRHAVSMQAALWPHACGKQSACRRRCGGMHAASRPHAGGATAACMRQAVRMQATLWRHTCGKQVAACRRDTSHAGKQTGTQARMAACMHASMWAGTMAVRALTCALTSSGFVCSVSCGFGPAQTSQRADRLTCYDPTSSTCAASCGIRSRKRQCMDEKTSRLLPGWLFSVSGSAWIRPPAE
eukprot:365249-Chlamydomonas_euryale.AAC.10